MTIFQEKFWCEKRWKEKKISLGFNEYEEKHRCQPRINDLKNEIQTLKLLLATESAKSASLTKSLAASTSQNQTLNIKVNNLESEISDTSVKTENKVKFLQQQIVDLNTTIADLNKTLVEYESNATNYGSVVLKVESQNKELQLKNEELLNQIADLKSELTKSNSASSVLVQQNTDLADKVVDYTDRINAFASANESLNDSVNSLTDVNTRLTKELEEAKELQNQMKKLLND